MHQDQLKSNQTLHFSGLDFLRGIAILGVFFQHALYSLLLGPELMCIGWLNGIKRIHVSSNWQYLCYPMDFGHLGLSLFFVISGFCIHWSRLQWISNHSTEKFWMQYFTRRFFRIYPPYLGSIALVIIIGILFTSPRKLYFIQDIMPHLFLVQNMDKKQFFNINGSWWSIAVEVQLYIVYPAFIFFVEKLGFPIFLMISCLVMVLMSYLSSEYSVIHPPFWLTELPFCYWFTWGLGAFVAERQYHGNSKKYFKQIIFIPLIIIGFLSTAFQAISFITVPVASIVFAIWVESVLSPPKNKHSCIWNGVKFIGMISYSMYLIHQPLMGKLYPEVEKYMTHNSLMGAVTIGTFLVFIVTLGSSYIFWRYIEVPSHFLGRKLAKVQHC